MASLDRNLRRDLENAVKKARRVAEAGARDAVNQLAVGHHEPWSALSPEQRKLRNRLRAHGRQLGDKLDEKKGTQSIDRLAGECAYEHWHRLLFARFLAENDLLVEPDSGMALSLDECRELAREQSKDWLVLASDFAQRMLPQIFRAGDPVLELALPPEKRQELEAILEGLPREVFIADDSLGWVYQFWQAEQKDTVNASENKIGAEELPAVTQLFTEDYMVLFLLHNTLGAWWGGKVLADKPDLARSATSEDELRAACAVQGIEWSYLRFVREGDIWRPAAGTFPGWPTAAKALTVLDPCMGSGHFLAFALPMLVALRREEEKLSVAEAVDAVLRDNLFGLELDPRCTQIAAFNVGLTAWKLAGYRPLPALNLACAGLALTVSRETWLALVKQAPRLEAGMARLHELFVQAPVLGSLINPKVGGGTLLEAHFGELEPYIEQALAQERGDDSAHELAVVAAGITRAARLLSREFTLVVTNVPYLGHGKQEAVLKKHCAHWFPDSKADLATCMLERCVQFLSPGGTTALVSPQSWLFIGPYKKLRGRLLRDTTFNFVIHVGPRGFQTISGEIVNVNLVSLTRAAPTSDALFAGVDASELDTPDAKALSISTGELLVAHQRAQVANPDARIVITAIKRGSLLSDYASSYKGIATGDMCRFIRSFWELSTLDARWRPLQGSVEEHVDYGGRDMAVLWENGQGALYRFVAERLGKDSTGAWLRGENAWGRDGIAVSQMAGLTCSLYRGDLFDENTAVVIPKNSSYLLPIYAYMQSDEYARDVRKLDNSSLKIPNLTLIKVPFDVERWRRVAAESYPNGLPPVGSNDPTQTVFDAAIERSSLPLQVAVSAILGFSWPRQATGGDVPAFDSSHVDDDGIVCLAPVRGERSAADRVRALLASTYGAEWSATKLNALLDQVGHGGGSLEAWLRDSFFEQHCKLFQDRPFIWHVHDGLKEGFAAFVNYHKLAAPNGEGRRTLEKLIYTYLGDWLDRQRADQKAGVEGADGRVAAAEHLKRELEKILEGEPPYDIFVRWKPLHQQPIGWEPDIDDGVRVNIRPFMTAKPLNARGKNACILRVAPKIKWDKDRGKEPTREKADFPWFWSWDESTQDFAGGKEFDGNRWNNLHYTRAAKLAARERAKGGKS